MVLGMPMDSLFLDTRGLYALLLLIPLILLYLIKPKPTEKTIPSLMFFLRDMGAADKRSFFKRFSKDWLFWIQLLTLLLLALAVAKPFIEVPQGDLAKNTVIVIDASASMQTEYEDTTRFEEAKEIALDNLGNVNTIIVAKNIPVVAKEEVDQTEAREFLEGLKPADTSTAIYDSARSALDYAGEDSKVVVVSDFLETEVDNDVNTAKRALKAKGAVVEFIPVSSEVGNIGIVDVVVKDETTSVQVRNYYPERKAVGVNINNIQETMNLEPGAADVITFSTPKGVNQVKLDVEDAFPVDNSAHISTPKTTSLDVLVITNDPDVEKSNLWVALKAINEKTNYELSIEKRVPPKSVRVEHDLIILKDFDMGKILPGVFNDIEEEVEESGASLIITAQRGMFDFGPLKSLMPVDNKGEVKTGSEIFVAKPEIGSLTEDVTFGSADYYYNTDAKDGVRRIAGTARDNGTIIAFEQRGAGKIFYYGIFDHDIQVDGDTMRSTFKNDLFYPIFWKRVMNVLTETPSVESLNRRTGKVINLAKDQTVETPEGGEVQGVFMMERQGIYSFRNQDIAVNLINSKESDVSGKFSETETPDVEAETVESKAPKPLTEWFIAVGLLLLLLELLYTKFRGDM